MAASQPANFNLQEFTDAGQLLVGGRLYTYAYGTTAQKTAYTDPAGTIPHSYTPDGTGGQYIALNARGELPAPLYLGAGSYDLALKRADGSTVWTRKADGVDNANNSLVALLASSLGTSVIGFVQAGVGAVLRWVLDKLRERISVLDFGAKGDGITDDTAAIQAAVTAAAGKRLYFPGTAASYLISDVINVSSDTTIYGDGEKSLIKLMNGNKSGFFGTGVNNVKVADLGILCQSAGTTAYIGGVYFFNSQKCRVENVEFVGMSWAGVLLNNSSRCSVVGCGFSGWLGTIQDSADINNYQNSNFNFISGNRCYGGGDHGILLYDPYANTSPTGNIVTGNIVDEHKAYGILEYIALATTQPYNARTVISNNVVSNILGTGPGTGGFSGAGIYVQAGGGTIVTGNSIYNCCRQTSNFDTLGMAGLVYQIGETATGAEIEGIVADNHVHMLRGPAMFLSASNRTINADNNVLKCTDTSNVRGEALIVQNCNAVRLTNNTIRHQNPNFYAVKLVAIGKEYSGHSLTGNTVICVNSAGGFLVTVSGGGSINSLIMANNTVFGSLANPAYSVQNVANMRFIGNHGDSSGIVFSMFNCQRARLSNNRLHSSYGTYSILFIGTNTGSLADESNDFDGFVENDAGNGCKVTMFGTTAPAANGLWDVGDTVININPSVGFPDRWRCTVAGYPGTWAKVLLTA